MDMKSIVKVFLLFLFFGKTFSQSTQYQVRDKVSEIVNKNSLFGDVILSTNGFGIGIFFSKPISETSSLSTEFSISNITDDNEVTVYDVYGNVYTPNKINRFLAFPFLFGYEQRLFADEIEENFRPFVSGLLGPSVVFSSPAQEEFFSSLKNGKSYFGYSGEIKFGTYIGNFENEVIKISLNYTFTKIGKKLESMKYENGEIKTMDKFNRFAIVFSFGNFF